MKAIAAGEGGGVTIGSLATLKQVAADANVREQAAVLSEACGDAASPQLRAVATVGGNLCQRPRCWYFRHAEYDCLKKGGSTCYAVEGDNGFHALFQQGTCHIVHPSNVGVALLALGGNVHVARVGAADRVITAEAFFAGPGADIRRENVLEAGDLITHVSTPRAPDASTYVAHKQRRAFDWPLASCAVARFGGEWRVALGHVAPTPIRSAAAEEALAGHDAPDLATIARAADAALTGAQPMSGNAWRLAILRAAVHDALAHAAGHPAAADSWRADEEDA
jgi:xanthine dehydrogenase YagS FAD-binding subunit